MTVNKHHLGRVIVAGLLIGSVATGSFGARPAQQAGAEPSGQSSAASSSSTAAKGSTPTHPLPAVDATPNAQRPSSGIPDDKAYKISPGDDIEVYVWGDDRLQRDIRVLPDGSIAFPLAGTVRAAGRTSTQLENDIATRLATQYKGATPQVTVSVKAPSGLTISVVGKVRAPGTFSPGRYVNLLEAISQAGGPSDFADVNNIVVLRKAGGSLQVLNASLTQVLKGKPSAHDLSQGIMVLQPGDTVIVP